MKKVLLIILILIGIVIFSKNVNAQDLVGYWKFDEGSGTTTSDSSGNANHGTTTGEPAWIDGKYGQALEFNQSWVDIPNSSSLSIPGSLTISLWYKDYNSSGTLLKKGDSNDCVNYQVGLDRRPGYMQVYWIQDNCSSTFIRYSIPIPSPYEWHHLAIVRDDVTLKYKFYIDGELKSTKNIKPESMNPHLSQIVRIGMGHWTGGTKFNGTIDEVVIFNRSLNATEIEELYLLGMPITPVNITGIVTDSWTRLPIPDAIVSCDGYQDITDTNGYYLLNIPAGPCNLAASKHDYVIQSIFVDYTEGTHTIDFNLEPFTFSVSGKLADKNGNAVQADVSLYKLKTVIKNNITEIDGTYKLSVIPDIYDFQTKITNFFIPNFYIKLTSVDVSADLSNILNYITENRSFNKLSFIVNITYQTIQTHSPEKPKRVLENGTELNESNSSNLKTGTWFYDSSEQKLYIRPHYHPTRLRTDGKYIKNEYGQIIYLTGVSWWELTAEHSLMEREHADTEEGQMELRIQRTKGLGIPFVRIHIGQSLWENFDLCKPRLDYVVQRCFEEGIYVLIDIHYGSTAREWWGEIGQQTLLDNHNAVMCPDCTLGYLDWVKEMANRYKDNPAVIGFQNWAEPAWADYPHDMQYYPELFSKWRNFNIDVFDAIRSVSPESLFVVLTPGYYTFKEVHPNWIDNPMPQPNVIYGVQRYLELGLIGSDDQTLFHDHYINGDYEAGKTGLEVYLQKYYFDFLEQNIGPVINCEFGFIHDLSRPEELRIAQDFYDLHKQYNAHWVQFAWSGSPLPEGGGSGWGILDSVAGWNDSINYWSLTPSGELMVQNLYSTH